MPRLFTGIRVPNEITRYLALKRAKLAGARWIDMENCHITLRFIGDIETDIAEEVHFALSTIEHGSFRVRLNGLGVFGAKKPRTLFVDIDDNEELSDLQAKHERVMRGIGLAPEKRNFAPHITLARLGGLRAQVVARLIEQLGQLEPMEFEVHNFALFSARDSIGGGPYLVEESYSLLE